MHAPIAPHLLWIDLDAAAPSLASVTGWLTPDERASACRFATPELRAQALSARIFLRGVLAQALQIAPSAILFEVGRWGKPQVCGGPQFNLSHSGSLAVVAMHPHLPVGLDVEADAHSVPVSALAHILSVSEATSMPKTTDEWLRLWVRKEAVVKAQGKGFCSDPRRFSVGHEEIGIWRKVPETEEVLFDGKLVSGNSVAVALTAPCCPSTHPTITKCDAATLIGFASHFAPTEIWQAANGRLLRQNRGDDAATLATSQTSPE
jgi:4'-phosphopantetheinyl transferase